MVRTQIQLTEAQASALKRLAAERHLSMAELVRQGVAAVLRAHVMEDVETRRQRAIALAGKYRSGKHNVARDHDRYLGETFRI